MTEATDSQFPEMPPPASYVWANQMPYIWAGIIFAMLGGLFTLALLALRPSLDPLILITVISGIGGSMFTGVAAYLKSQQTHNSVNGQLQAWKRDFYTMAHAQGKIEGVSAEQARVAEQMRVQALKDSVPVVPERTTVIVNKPTVLP